MPLRLNGSTSGYSELSAPAVAGNNSIALPTGNGSAYQVLRNGATAGSLEYADNIVSGTAVASTSGTSIDFTGIPSWVKRVTVMFNAVSTTGTNAIVVQVGTSGGIVTSGYLGTQTTATSAIGSINFTTGFQVTFGSGGDAAASVRHGFFTIANVSGNNWVANGIIGFSNEARMCWTSGSVPLAAVLDRVRITTVSGTDTFDAGSINILME